MKKNRGLKIILIVVLILTVLTAILATKEYNTYRTLQDKFEKYCDAYDKLWEKNSDIIYHLEKAGVKIDEKKLLDEY